MRRNWSSLKEIRWPFEVRVQTSHRPDAEAIPQGCGRRRDRFPQCLPNAHWPTMVARRLATLQTPWATLTIAFAMLSTVAGLHPKSCAIENFDRPTALIRMMVALRNTVASVVEKRTSSNASHSDRSNSNAARLPRAVEETFAAARSLLIKDSQLKSFCGSLGRMRVFECKMSKTVYL